MVLVLASPGLVLDRSGAKLSRFALSLPLTHVGSVHLPRAVSSFHMVLAFASPGLTLDRSGAKLGRFALSLPLLKMI